MVVKPCGFILIVVSVDPDHVVHHASDPDHLQVFDWSGDCISVLGLLIGHDLLG